MEMVTPRIDILEDGANYGKFVVEPLGQGFGYTIGNALRRVLLASIPGAAITSIKIDGVLHEFSTIPGVMEDTTELILNLRELFVQMDGEVEYEDEPIVTIDVHGPGEITGADIKCPAGISIANPEVHIATLDSETAVLRAELTVEIGKGYVLPEKQERVKQSIGVIPVGAVFTPVLKVAYTVDPTRVGHKTDFDRMVLEVTTNGTVRPSDAVSEAAKILDRQLRLFFDFAREPRSGRIGEEAYRPISPGAPDARIEELDFSVRTYNCLKKANVLTIRELVQFSEVDLMNIRNFGRKSLDEIKKKLADMNLSLRPTGPGEVRIQHQDVDEEEERALDSKIEDCEDFGARTKNCLKKDDIITFRDLVKRSEVDLMNLVDFGKVPLSEVKNKLDKLNIKLRDAGHDEVITSDQDYNEDDEITDETEELSEVIAPDQDDSEKDEDSAEELDEVK